MKNKIFKIAGAFILLSVFIFINALEAAQDATVNISLIYPQNNNAPKREPQKKAKPAVLKNAVLIDISGISPAQLKSPDLYVEYFLDDALIYSTQAKEQDKPKQVSLSFILDTTKYEDGNHQLVVNLWDKNGPSAIGIRQITIQNGTQNNGN